MNSLLLTLKMLEDPLSSCRPLEYHLMTAQGLTQNDEDWSALDKFLLEGHYYSLSSCWSQKLEYKHLYNQHF